MPVNVLFVAHAMATLTEISSSLQCGERVTDALRDLSILLEANDSPKFVQDVLVQVPLPLVFGYLQPAIDSDQTRLACSVLEKILSRMPAQEMVKISTYIELGLQYSNPAVKKTCLVALNTNSTQPEVSALITSPTMFHLITQVLADDNLECAMIASNILLKFLSHPSLLATSLRDALVIDLTGIMTINSTVRYRVFELGVQAAISGGESFELISSSGLLSKLVEELNHEDILAQLNCVELLLTLQDSEDGTVFLETNMILGRLHDILRSAQQDPFGVVIIPGLIKFFGHIAVSPRVNDVASLVSQFPLFLSVVLEAVHNPRDDTMWGIAVDTFGLLGSNERTREALKEHSTKTEGCLKSLGLFISNGSPVVRTRSLNAVSKILSCPERFTAPEESTSMKWFNALGRKMFATMMSIARQPFADIRHSALNVVLSMAAYEWGQKEMTRFPGFLEYLLDRHTEPDKEGKEIKFEIVHVMVESTCAEVVWGNVDFLKLRKYDREGPFYYTSDSTVATEEST